jgi:hypothetical protein
MHPSPEPTSSFRLYAALICIKSVRHRAERRRRSRGAAEPAAEARRALVPRPREISTRSLLHETLSSPPRLLLRPRPVYWLDLRRRNCAYPVILAAESDEVVKRLETWKEEIGSAFDGRESGKALYLSPDRPLSDSAGARTLETDIALVGGPTNGAKKESPANGAKGITMKRKHRGAATRPD